ncbi:MAG: EAL domain-containing protein [Burkholderiaceae bacterium]|nr:EAL domain-containing protein [Burkholderiaceae bacterium]
MLASSYNNLLVLLSIAVAILASYTALDMAGRINSSQGRAANYWLIGGACAMGMGIWSMHFIGMLAFSLPIALGYDPITTLISLLIAIISSAFALWMVCQKTLPRNRLVGGAILLGAGIASMHYTGMAAMQMVPGIHYIPSLFALSILIAILASGAALWTAFHLRRHSSRVRSLRAAAAVVMGFSIVGMHYTGMAAAEFPLGSVCGAASNGVTAGWLALIVVIITLAVLAMALIISVLDLRLRADAATVTSLAAENQELTYLALHDNLTRLPNRLLLEDRLNIAIQIAKRDHRSFAVMFLDLDEFKVINDSYGHSIGDQFLVAVAQRLASSVRGQDTLARLGGDEFVLVANITNPADAATLAEKTLTTMQSVFEIADHKLSVSTSIGIALYPEDGELPHELLQSADTAMYHAKAMGRNTYSYFAASANPDAQEQLQLIQDLRAAVDSQQLVLHYQPKFTAHHGPLIGVEALLRWEHPTRGVLAPDDFIPLAEKTGLITPIGLWVLDQACQQISQWQRDGYNIPTVSVNLSALQFNHADLMATVKDTLNRHALTADCLTLEISEPTVMADRDTSMRILQPLHGIGISISIDDFGTGYSNLMHLKQLPIHELKIDRGLIRGLGHDTENSAVVTAIIALGKALDLRIVAEGVETAAQLDLLTQLGCDALQGFLLGHPMLPIPLIDSLTKKTANTQPAV